jgi:hypothetical protein
MASRMDWVPDRSAKVAVAGRLAEVRREVFGEHGGPELARLLGLPYWTWRNYENGVTVPGEIVLRFIELTSVEPTWLLQGEGPKYRASHHHERRTPWN